MGNGEKQKHMFKGLCNIREIDLIVNIIQKMFNFELEVSDLERDLFSVKEKMELIFNFIDLSFQLYNGPVDNNVATLLKKLNELRRYYDKKNPLETFITLKQSLISLDFAPETTLFCSLR